MIRHIHEVANAAQRGRVTFSKETEQLLGKLMELDFDLSEVMNPTNLIVARAQFLGDASLRKPNFEFQNIARYAESGLWEQLAELGEEIARQPLNLDKTATLELQLVREFFESVSQKHQFLLAAKAFNCFGAAATSESNPLKEAFYTSQEAIFKAPVLDTFLQTLAYELSLVQAAMPSFSKEDTKKCIELKNRLGAFWEAAEECRETEVKEVPFDRFCEIIEQYFYDLTIMIPTFARDGGTDFTADDIAYWLKIVIRSELRNFATGELLTDFRAEVSDDITAFSVNQQERTIKVPRDRPAGNYSREDFKALVLGHEFGTYVLRGVPFEKSGMKLLSTGLPGYLDFEEGVACCTEMALRHRQRTVGYAHYTNIGLAYFGYHYDFRDIFDIRTRLTYLAGMKDGETEEAKLKRWRKARNTAFAQTTRCFRGTGELVNFKDLAYYNGADKVWDYITTHIDEPDELMRGLFWSGKTDITNPTHRKLVAMALGEEF